MEGALAVVRELWVYPIKSARGISLPRARLASRGFEHDRRWMVVDGAGRFLTQRTLPRMALIEVAIEPGGLRVVAPGMPPLRVPFSVAGPAREVEVFADRCAAISTGEEAAGWMTRFLGAACDLVWMPEESVRLVDRDYSATATGVGDQVSFVDGFPLLLVSQASLDDLNRRLAAPVEMARFRPNIVVDGCAPFAEDSWTALRIGEVPMRGVKRCARCPIPSVDPATGERGEEPIATLGGYRRVGGQVLFGQNVIHSGLGELAIGDVVGCLTEKGVPPLT
ncbi:MAG: MOSC domain-containing protein [Myxococcales bacterium]|nr:MOSC domain-containing protein [Myxococcales bacterium]